MTPEEREERLAIMIFDGGLSESEAIAIIDMAQMELFERGKG